MDLEIVGFDASETTAYFPSSISTSDFDPKQRLHGSVPQDFFSLRSSSSSSINGGGNSISENGQQMLSFSYPNLQTAPSGYGYGYGHGVFINRVRGPFTQSQWMELENQALIYKYINANTPVPSNLLIPIIKASHYAHFPPFSVGWAPFHLRFSNSTDPEPGRCRRTDGKKWRCSKDAVPDQKYCERHMNRGRHRSRKPVENQPGHSVSAAAAASSKQAVQPNVAAAAAADDDLSLSQPGGPHCGPSGLNNNSNNRVFLNRETMSGKIQDSFSQSILYPSSNLKTTQFSNDPNHQTLCCSPASYHNNNKNNNSWPETNDERTQLSISIPMATSDFMPTNSSTAKDPLTKMGLGFGSQKQATNWIPVSWGSSTSMGGPLGEVLNKTHRNSSGSVSNSSYGSSLRTTDQSHIS